MAARQTDHFTVSRPDDLDELERRLVDDGLIELTLDVPESATTLFTAREFRRLAASARSAGVILRVATDDPLRIELARIIGLPIATSSAASDRRRLPDTSSTESAKPIQPVQVDDAPTRRIGVQASDPSAGTYSVPLTPWREHDTLPDDDDADDEGSYSFVITPPRRPAQGRTEDLDASWTAWASRSFEAADDRARPARRRRRRAPIILAMLLPGLISGVLLAVVVAPSATIAVTPRIDTVEAQISYGLAGAGRSFDLAIEPQTIATTITSTASIPTTGERFVPDATATGALLLTNPTLAEVYVAAGSVATSADGGEYLTTTDVVVPAADPYRSMTFGSVAAPVRAVEPGAEGNADAETIYGQWDTGIFYTNHDAITGGTMKRIATVAEADRAALEATARADLDGRAAGVVAAMIPAGASLVPDSTQRGEVTLRFDHATGDDATLLRLDASMPASAQVFDPAAMRAQAGQEVERRLTASAIDGDVVEGSLQVADPTPLGPTPADGFTIAASARLARPVDDTALAELRADAAGADVADIASRAGDLQGVDTVSVHQRNAWLWHGMPLLTSRITIEVLGGQTTVSAKDAPAGR